MPALAKLQRAEFLKAIEDAKAANPARSHIEIIHEAEDKTLPPNKRRHHRFPSKYRGGVKEALERGAARAARSQVTPPPPATPEAEEATADDRKFLSLVENAWMAGNETTLIMDITRRKKPRPPEPPPAQP